MLPIWLPLGVILDDGSPLYWIGQILGWL